jgi:hypothetical protein
VCPKQRSYAKVMPSRSRYTKLPKIGSTKLLAFCLLGLWFWILFMLKRPLEPHCNNHILVNVSSGHISSQRYDSTILASLSLCISTVLYISLINRNCILMYLCVYGYISNKYMLYYWIYDISLYIYLLYLLSHFVLKIIQISGT